MLIELDLNTNDMEALLRHCIEYQPSSGDFRDDARLREALEALATAINNGMRPMHASSESTETIDPREFEAAIAVFGDKKIALNWLSKPLRFVKPHRRQYRHWRLSTLENSLQAKLFLRCMHLITQLQRSTGLASGS